MSVELYTRKISRVGDALRIMCCMLVTGRSLALKMPQNYVLYAGHRHSKIWREAIKKRRSFSVTGNKRGQPKIQWDECTSCQIFLRSKIDGRCVKNCASGICNILNSALLTGISRFVFKFFVTCSTDSR